MLRGIVLRRRHKGSGRIVRFNGQRTIGQVEWSWFNERIPHRRAGLRVIRNSVARSDLREEVATRHGNRFAQLIL